MHRQIGFGTSPLTIIDIKSFLDLFDFDDEKNRETFNLVCALDAHWLEWARDPAREKERKDAERSEREQKKAMDQLRKK